MDDWTKLVERLTNPLWEHGEHFESPQLAKYETRTDMLFAAEAISRLAAELDAMLAKTVRKLDWETTFEDRGDGSSEEKGFEAEAPWGNWYRIEMYFASDSYGWQVEYDHTILGNFDDPDKAKDCAQDHFDKCVTAALATTSDTDANGAPNA